MSDRADTPGRQAASKRLLQVAVSDQEYEVLREMARQRNVSMTDVLRQGIHLQRRLEKLETAQVVVPAQGPDGTSHALIAAADVLDLVK